MRRDDAPVAPLYVGPANAEHVLGWSWRYTRDWAREHGVPILRAGAKPLIRLAELQAAIEREAAREQREPVDELAAMRARVAQAGQR